MKELLVLAAILQNTDHGLNSIAELLDLELDELWGTSFIPFSNQRGQRKLQDLLAFLAQYESLY